jgi:hypothetical protein
MQPTCDLITLFRDRPQPVADQGQSALRRGEGDQRRVVIVVVGVTPHRGDDSTDYRAKDHREYRSGTHEYGGTRPHARPME